VRNASAAQKNFGRHPKKTFSTLSALFGHAAISELSLRSGVKRKLDLEPAKGGFWRKEDVGQIPMSVKCLPKAAVPRAPDYAMAARFRHASTFRQI
jgi:hypothetical protein